MIKRLRRRDRDSQCVGISISGLRCALNGRRREDNQFWCHLHVVQLLSQTIHQESLE